MTDTIVTFQVTESDARHLDLLVREAGGDPAAWIASIIADDRKRRAREVGTRIDEMSKLVSAHGVDAEGLMDIAPSSGRHTRPPREHPSSAWRQ